MTLSCIIPTFNRSEFLIEALNSVLRQTLPPTEIIVVNNGRTQVVLSDNLRNKVGVYNTVFRAGASQARNLGATVATGDFLAFLDDDDLWGEDYLARAVEALCAGADCVVSRLDKMIGDEVKPYKNAFGRLNIKKLLISNPGVTGSNVVIKKELFLSIGGFDAELPTSNDKSFMIEVIRSGAKIMVLPKSQAIYREHDGEKVTQPEKSARGVRRFTEKYRQLMSWREYLINLKKYYKHRFNV